MMTDDTYDNVSYETENTEPDDTTDVTAEGEYTDRYEDSDLEVDTRRDHKVISDKEIIDLYWSRDESAIEATDIKYGSFCQRVSYNIIRNMMDAEECKSDTYYTLWKTIPPTRPNNLVTYIAVIARNITIDSLRRRKRSDSHELLLIEEELSGIVDLATESDRQIDKLLITETINGFLKTQKKRNRNIFVMRYFYILSNNEIARQVKITPTQVSTILMRTRDELRKFFENEGYDISGYILRGKKENDL